MMRMWKKGISKLLGVNKEPKLLFFLCIRSFEKVPTIRKRGLREVTVIHLFPNRPTKTKEIW